MRRSRLTRDALRRSGTAGIESISFNGGPAQTGSIALRSPMFADVAGPNTRIDNGNVKQLVDAVTITGIDVDLNQSFFVVLQGARTFAIPTASIITTPREGEKITFTIGQGPGGPYTPTWTGGANGYMFANAASAQGVTVAQANALAAATPVGSVSKIGFEFNSSLARWLAVALAGYWP
jgi:hypothetical protein